MSEPIDTDAARERLRAAELPLWESIADIWQASIFAKVHGRPPTPQEVADMRAWRRSPEFARFDDDYEDDA